LAGSLSRKIKETHGNAGFPCAEHNIVLDVEIIAMDEINEAYERTIAGECSVSICD